MSLPLCTLRPLSNYRLKPKVAQSYPHTEANCSLSLVANSIRKSIQHSREAYDDTGCYIDRIDPLAKIPVF